MLKLLPGVHQYKSEVHTKKKELFDKLATGQSPDAIFITCSDSRVDPSMITQTDPGTLFVIRNAGNIVPAWSASEPSPGEEATIEYALDALKVKDIIVCGHSSCGAMHGLLNLNKLTAMPAVKKWLDSAGKTLEIIERQHSELDEKAKLAMAIQVNVLVQIEHLKSLPCVSKRLAKGEVTLHGWIYDIGSGEVFIHDAADGCFKASVKSGDGFELTKDRTFVKK